MYQKLNTKILSILSLLTAMIFIISSFVNVESNLINTLLWIASDLMILFWITLMVRYSNIRTTYYWRLVLISFSISLIGILAKLQHWYWSRTVLLIGISGIVISYLIRFIRKPIKLRLDYLKILTVTSFLTYYYCQQIHILPNGYAIICWIFLLITIYEFSFQFDKMKSKEIKTGANMWQLRNGG